MKKKTTKKINPFISREERIEPINPDSLDDAFEVASDEIERIFNFLKKK
jgi:hypothetical protein